MNVPRNQSVKRSELRRFFDGIGARMELEGVRLGGGVWCPTVDQAELARFFNIIGSRMGRDRSSLTQGRVGQQDLEQFFAAFDQRATLAEARQRRVDKTRATRFNVFELIKPDENRLSDILKILLDPEGEHGQGDLFLRLFLKKLEEELDFGLVAKLNKHVTVRREAPTHGIEKYRRRMDILVEGGVLVAIENKVDSAEQEDQVKDYLEHLRRYTAGHSIQWALIYLTPEARQPESLATAVLEQQEADGRLHCWSYQVELRAWLEECRRQCAARKIQDFLSDFMNYIESTIKREPEISTEEDDNEE